MKKFLSLLRANTKGDLNVFKIKSEGKRGILLLLLLSICVMFAMYSYADLLMEPLHELGLSYIGISLFSIMVLLLIFIKGINNSQGLIFEAKDNNLLFSMPINKNYILIVRFLRILLFDYLFEILFLLPSIIKYIILTSPSISFYIITLIFLIVFPLIPLVFACVIGYIIKLISVKFKKQKLIQTILTCILFFCLLMISFKLEDIVLNIVEKATSINDFINKLYLPIGLYIELINEFNILKLLELIFLSIIPFILFIVIFNKYYDLIINKSKESITNSSKENKINKLQSKSIIKSLIKKELKTYFGIPIYVFNTIISPILALIFPVALIFKYDDVMNMISGYGIPNNMIDELLPFIFIAMIIILLSMCSITASSISLEGKKYSLLKSLPVKTKDIFISKLLLNEIILVPAFLLSAIVYITVMKIFNYNIIFIVLSIILLTRINGEIGLIINLMYPKLDFSSEVEVVKQSMSVLIAMLFNLIFSLAVIFSFYKLYNVVNTTLLASIYIIVFIIIILILDKVLNTFGVKKFKAID